MAKPAKSPEKQEAAKQTYFVPGRGEFEATDLEDLNKQLKTLNEQEDGDGDR